MKYHLTLPKGAITLRNGIYRGSSTEAVWSPYNPIETGGWEPGDQLEVICTFNLNPDVNPKPPAREYAGLCVGACNSTNQTAVQALESQARSLGLGNKGQLLGTHISTADTAQDSDIFYKSGPTAVTIQLQPTSRGVLENYIYKWNLHYNGGNTVAPGNEVEIVFGYGDPQFSEVDS